MLLKVKLRSIDVIIASFLICIFHTVPTSPISVASGRHQMGELNMANAQRTEQSCTLSRSHRTHQRARVSGISRSVIQEAWEAKVRDLAHQVAVDQDISGSEVSVDVVHVWQVLHPCSNASQHPNQLRHGEAPVVQLQKRPGWERKKWKMRRGEDELWRSRW